MLKLAPFGHILASSRAQRGQAVPGALPAEPARSWKGAPHCRTLHCTPAAPELSRGAQRSSGEAKLLFYRAALAIPPRVAAATCKHQISFSSGTSWRAAQTLEMQHLPGGFVDLKRCLRGLKEEFEPLARILWARQCWHCVRALQGGAAWGSSSFNSAMNFHLVSFMYAPVRPAERNLRS